MYEHLDHIPDAELTKDIEDTLEEIAALRLIADGMRRFAAVDLDNARAVTRCNLIIPTDTAERSAVVAKLEAVQAERAKRCAPQYAI